MVVRDHFAERFLLRGRPDVLSYLELVLDAMVPGRDWRILMVDDYRAQTTLAVRRAAWHSGYVLIAHGGGMQVSDTDLHQPLKRD